MNFAKLIWCWWMRGILFVALVNCALMPSWGAVGLTDSMIYGKQNPRRASRERSQTWLADGYNFMMFEDEPVWIWRSNSPYTAVVYIDRYFGSPNEIQTQIDKGLMNRFAQVEVVTYDCDRNTYVDNVEPEYDEVYINGNRLGFLDGYHEASFATSFPVDIEYLNLPSHPGDIAENKIEIRVDTKNKKDEWVLYPQMVRIKIEAPLPIYMVKGWTNSWKNIDKLKKTVSEEYGLPVIKAPVAQDNDCATNAELMHHDLVDLTERCGVPYFNILAHSKGGLDSRFLVDKAGCDNTCVKNVLQIATPNCGSRLADFIVDPKARDGGGLIGFLCGRIWSVTPGVTSLTTPECWKFNGKIKDSNAPVHVVIGDTSNKVWFFQRWIGEANYNHDFKSSDINRHGDIMVSIPSSHGSLKLAPLYDKDNLSPASNGYLVTADRLVDDGSTYTEHSNIITDGAKRVLAYYENFLTAPFDEWGLNHHTIFPDERSGEKSRRKANGTQEQQIGVALSAAGLLREESKATSESVMAMAPRRGMDMALKDTEEEEVTEEQLESLMTEFNLSRSDALAIVTAMLLLKKQGYDGGGAGRLGENCNKETMKITVSNEEDGVARFNVQYPGPLVINITGFSAECRMHLIAPDGKKSTLSSVSVTTSLKGERHHGIFFSNDVSLSGEYEIRIVMDGELKEAETVECFIASASSPEAPKPKLEFEKSYDAAAGEFTCSAWVEYDGKLVRREGEEISLSCVDYDKWGVASPKVVTMHDDGLDGDEVAGDGKYFARVKVEKDRAYMVTIEAQGKFAGVRNQIVGGTKVYATAEPICWVDDVIPLNGRCYDILESRGMGASVQINASLNVDGVFSLTMILEDEKGRELRLGSKSVQWNADETKTLQLSTTQVMLENSKVEGALQIKGFEVHQNVGRALRFGKIVRRSEQLGEPVVDPRLVVRPWQRKANWPQIIQVSKEELEYEEAFPHFKAMYLRLDIQVQAPPKYSGMYYLTGMLYDLDGNKLADSVYTPVDMRGVEENGQLVSTQVSMRFSGGILNRRRINGPMVLKHVAFTRCNDPRFNRREVRGFSYRTQSYNWEQFQNSNQWCYEAMLVEPIRATTPDESGRFDLTLKATPVSGGGMLTGPFGIVLKDYYMSEYPGAVILAEKNSIDLYEQEGYLLTDQIMEAAKSVGNCDGWLDLGESVEVTIPCIASGPARENPLGYLPYMRIWGEYAYEMPFMERDQVTSSPRHYFDVDEDGVITDDEVEYGVDCWNDGRVVHRTAITGLAAYLEAEGRYRYDNKSGDFLPDI